MGEHSKDTEEPLGVHRFRLFGLMEIDRLAGRTLSSPPICSNQPSWPTTSLLLTLRPCLELLCTNMFSEATTAWPSSRLKVVATATWNRRMSRGLPAFFRQFWLHFRKNLRLYLQERRGETSRLWTGEPQSPHRFPPLPSPSLPSSSAFGLSIFFLLRAEHKPI